MDTTTSETILDTLIDSCNSIRIFLFEKIPNTSNNFKVYMFPNAPTEDDINFYKSNFHFYVDDKDIVDYSYTEGKKDTIQKLSLTEFTQWELYKNLIDTFPVTNAPALKPENIKNLKMIVVECLVGEEKVYLISKYPSSSLYKKKRLYTFLGETLKKLNNEILVLCDYIDCFIVADSLYVLIESHFDTLFDFHKKIKDEASKNIHATDDWNFFDNNDISKEILDKPRRCRQFLKVLNSENLSAWKSKTPADRKLIITGDIKLKDKFEFDENDNIKFSKNSLNELFKLLNDDYFKSIITGETGER